MDYTKEIGTNAAVSVCQKVSDDLNRHLKILSYQLNNCQGCSINLDCTGHMRLERLQSGMCAYREIRMA